jgi:hypothetical protein
LRSSFEYRADSTISLNWVGWRQIIIPRSVFTVARSPLGWNQIDELSFVSTGYSLPPQDPQLGLFFDLFELADSPVGQALSDADFFTRHLNLSFPSLEAVKAAVQANGASTQAFANTIDHSNAIEFIKRYDDCTGCTGSIL